MVRPDTPVDALSLAQTRKLLMGEQEFWNSNLRVTLLLRAPAARERDVVLRVIYRMNEAEFRQYLDFKAVSSRSHQRTQGGLFQRNGDRTGERPARLGGFCGRREVPKGLKILKIDGKLPGQAGYPLK